MSKAAATKRLSPTSRHCVSARAGTSRRERSPKPTGDVETACKVLNEAPATELVCVLRYKRHYFMAKGIHAGPVKDEFLEHAAEEQEHADRIAERIVQLGGAQNFSPKDCCRGAIRNMLRGRRCST
jgi:DNA-binding ferritin-like protein